MVTYLLYEKKVIPDCLNLSDFNIAFGVFRDVICEIQPERRQELDIYLAIISDQAMSYGGMLF